ncbi:hypothetical protein [Sphingomonas sp. MMS24-J13]|uniref:hypothetical protein n=1 Tax=Sphingomonas sp. MMS24-J13 TaxID=3238686 RepID=UPI00384C2267
MAAYRICFFNDIPDSRGHDHHVCQRTIEIADATDEGQAIANAIGRFEQLENVSHWRLHARTFECAEIVPTRSIAD